MTVTQWWRQKTLHGSEGDQARAYLKRIGSVLADPNGTTELPEQEREQSKQESKRKYDKKARAALSEMQDKYRHFVTPKEGNKRRSKAEVQAFIQHLIDKYSRSEEGPPHKAAKDFQAWLESEK